MEKVIDTLKAEWATIRQAPWSFLVVVGTVAVILWWVLQQRVDQKTDLIGTQEKLIATLRNQLDVKKNEPACAVASRIDPLEPNLPTTRTALRSGDQKRAQAPALVKAEQHGAPGSANVAGNDNTVIIAPQLDTRNSAHRSVLADLLASGNMLIRECDTLEEKLDLMARTESWAKTAIEKLKSLDPAYVAQFNAARGLPMSWTVGDKPIPQTHQQIKNYLDARLQLLSRLLERL